ncbi:MAG TPA: hypothetical protein VIX17_17925 [Pyrinomonadaceae bacterium]|jgi:hypothetical protein
MKKQGLSVLAAVVLGLATAAFALGQVTTTKVTKTVQNPDGTYTVIEYPAKKEVMINLNPVNITGAKGVATIMRDDDGTHIKLNLTSIPADVTALNLYAVDDTGAVTPIGPVTISNGTGTLTSSVPLSKFMLIASPDASLSTYGPSTAVVFRSAVPEGYTVIPVSSARGETVAAVAAPTTAAPTTTVVAPATAAPATAVVAAQGAYQVAMLNIPSYKKGDDTKIKVDFTGAMTGARANVFITPRKDGPTEVRVKFHDLKEAPADQKFILWAVSPDNTFHQIGQVISTGAKNEAEIKGDTDFKDFGLLITAENAIGASPVGPVVGTITIVP